VFGKDLDYSLCPGRRFTDPAAYLAYKTLAVAIGHLVPGGGIHFRRGRHHWHPDVAAGPIELRRPIGCPLASFI
jgi:hypothetical protein